MHTDLYKQQAESFVTGFSGTSMWVVFLASAVTPCAFFFRSLLMGFTSSDSPWISLSLDILVVVLPSLLAITWVDWDLVIILLLVTASFLLTLLKPRLLALERENVSSSSLQFASLQNRYKQFISQFKVSLMLGTCLSILAVDFKIFPRYFVKTETFGTSLMDLGVGSFIFLHALTHPPRRASIKKNFAAMVPLLMIGFLRIVAAKGVNYQEHVSEYGTHWNFFFTLATTAFFSGICEPSHPGIMGGFVLVVYQMALSWGGLTDYVMDHPRTNIFHANKEGVCSSIGYFALYLLSAQVGRFSLDEDKKIDNLVERWRVKMICLVALDVILWISAVMADVMIQPVSRRLMNFSYILWILAMNVFELTVALGCQLAFSNPQPTILVASIGRNSLAFFLLCNLFTGLVNLSMETIFASDFTAFVVLILYISIALSISLVLHLRDINVKI